MRKYTRDLYSGSRRRRDWRPASSPSASSRWPPTKDASRSTGGSPRSTATAASTCTRSRPREVQELFPLAQHRRHARRLLREGGRPRESGRRDDGARQGRAHAGRDDHRGRAGRPASLQKRGAVTGVRTAHGDIEAEYVVNCAGMWARQLGERGRRQHPAAGGRALLPDHRADRRAVERLAGARGSGVATATSARRSAG